MDEKLDLITTIQEVLGRTPQGTVELLNVLVRPEVIEVTKRYVAAYHRCERFKAPLNCARNAEHEYENLKYGWLGGVSTIGYDESWCEPCRKRAMGDE